MFDSITEHAKKNSVLYHAIQKLFEKNESGISEFDKIQRYKYDDKTADIIERTEEEKKHFEEERVFLTSFLEKWIEIPLLTFLNQCSSDTLTFIIFLMNEETKKTNKR